MIRRGFSLIEAVISIVLVAVVLVGGLASASMSIRASQANVDHAMVNRLAHDLMAEILSHPYNDPDASDGTIGKDSGEGGSDRSDFDDVDDFHQWQKQPQRTDGTPLSGADGLKRTVIVEWVQPGTLDVSASETGIKRITVEVHGEGLLLKTLVAFRTNAWADEEDESGPGTDVLFVSTGLGVSGPGGVFFVPDPADQARITLLESWGFTVDYIGDPGVSTSELATSAEQADVVYISSILDENDGSTFATALRESSTGIVVEHGGLYDEFGIASKDQGRADDSLLVLDNSHYITSTFPEEWIVICDSPQDLLTLDGFVGPDIQFLGRASAGGVTTLPSLSVIETGGTLYGGGTANGRRVQLPWAGTNFDVGALKADGLTIMLRSVEWAAGEDGAP